MERYKAIKHKSQGKAIREFCIECMGGRGTGQNYTKLIKECTVQVCALHDFRFGTNPHHTLNLSDEERKRRAGVARKLFSKSGTLSKTA